ncbi:MAG: UPF0158 family protein, partial [Pirellulaceae bacterium]|nr:UPF0158 family protein [Pirellulaceae bacterium]
QIYYISDSHDGDQPPNDFEESDRYLLVPDKQELDLGQSLVREFISTFAPNLENEVRDIFRRRGAYGHFRALLENKRLLEKWYAFENERETSAIIDWCRENGIELSGT